MTWFVEGLRHNPELAIFLTLALGFLIGKLKIGGFSFGTVVGRSWRACCRAARHPGPRHRQDRLLRPVPLHDRLQGRAPVLPRPEEGRPLTGCGHGRAVRHVSRSPRLWPEAPRLRHGDGGRAPGRAFSESTVIGTAGDAINRLTTISAEEKARLVTTFRSPTRSPIWSGRPCSSGSFPRLGPSSWGSTSGTRRKKMQSQGGGAAVADPG